MRRKILFVLVAVWSLGSLLGAGSEASANGRVAKVAFEETPSRPAKPGLLQTPLPGSVTDTLFGKQWYEDRKRKYVDEGADFVVKTDEADVFAAAAGTVVFAGEDKGLKYDTICRTVVAIRHHGMSGVLETRYFGLNEISVKAGEKIGAGKKVGTVAKRLGLGSRPFNPRLHFEVIGPNGKVDPCGFFVCMYKTKK
jgi:murein DD-endopeptidase MepM/ murein hydrolase activator NlpD